MKYIGVDVHKNMLSVATIGDNLEIELVEDFYIDEFIVYIMKDSNIKIIAIDAPAGLNIGLMNDEEYRNKIDVKLKGHYNKKNSEYELSRRGINPFSTPGDISEVIGWKDWMNTGFDLYNKLQDLGFKLINSNNNGIEKDKGIIEVFPHACFTTLLGFVPSKKDSDKGLEERTNILTKIGFKNIDILLEKCNRHKKTDKLDAIVAAYTAYLTYEDEVSFVGDEKEGQIVLPIKELMDSYKRVKINNEKSEKVIINNPINEEHYKNGLVYKYLNVDSVIWFKYFTSLNNSPSIKEVVNSNLDTNIKVVIEDGNGKNIEVILEPLKNRNDGMKVTKEYKDSLRNFWGSHGDRKEYVIWL